MKPFESPRSTLGGLDPEQAAALIAATADVALVVDAAGIIRDVAFGSDELSNEGYSRWLGQPWIDTVTPESRPKVEALLRDAGSANASKWRHVNHPSSHGADVPVMYSAVQLGNNDRVVAVGRDLRAVASLQSRLVEAQQSMERDYWRLRQVETRYRLLFQMASEAVLVVDAGTERVAEANPAAAQLLGDNASRIIGRSFADCFDRRSAQSVDSVLASIRASGRAEDVRLRLADPGGGDCIVGGTLFRHDKSSSFLIRLTVPRTEPASTAEQRGRAGLLVAVENLPDAFVVTDMQGRVITANAAFYEMVEVLSEQQAKGVSLDQWLGRPGVDLNVLLTNLRQHGSVRLFATTVRGENGVVSEVEITAVAAHAADPPCLGFAIRNVERRLSLEAGPTSGIPRSMDQLRDLVGRVPMRDIVRDTTDVIERFCIGAALEITRDNRALAAEVLGLSRQSLYVKLRRFGIGDLGGDAEE